MAEDRNMKDHEGYPYFIIYAQDNFISLTEDADGDIERTWAAWLDGWNSAIEIKGAEYKSAMRHALGRD